MKKVIMSLLVVICSVIVAKDCAQCGQFVETMGGSNYDVGSSVIETFDGEIVVTGYTESFGAGGTDLLLAKFDPYGNALWTRTLGGSSSDVGHSVIETFDGGIVVTGYTESFGADRSDLLLTKFDSDGNHLWTRTIDIASVGSSEYGHSVIETSYGELVVAGYTHYWDWVDLLLVKFDSTGDLLWTKGVSGEFVGEEFNGHSVVETSDGGYLVAGKHIRVLGDYYILIVKFDFWGNREWASEAGFPAPYWWTTGYSLIRTSDAGFAIAGQAVGEEDERCPFLLKLDSEFDPIWGGVLYEPYSDGKGYSVIETSDGGLVVAGGHWYDILLAKWNATGGHEWTRVFAGIPGDFARSGSVIETAWDQLVITGTTDYFGFEGGLLLAQCNSNGQTCLPDSAGPEFLSHLVFVGETPTFEWDPPVEINHVVPTITSPPCTPTIVCYGSSTFVRGDAEANGDHDLFDGLRVIYWMGGLAPDPPCIAAADADDDVDMFDGLRIIYWLGGLAPPPPSPCCAIPGDCGPDPTQGPLTCLNYPPCDPKGKAVPTTASVGSPEESRLVVAFERAMAEDGTVDVTVTLTNAEPLVGFSWVMEYDPQLLRATVVDNSGLVTEEFDVFAGGVKEPGLVKVATIGDIDLADGVEKLPAGEHQVARIIFEQKVPSHDAPLKVSNSVMAADYNRALNHHVVVRTPPLPSAFQLDQNHPNPFNPTTQISYALPMDCHVRLDVYNTLGQRVATLVDELQQAGYSTVRWDGKDQRGEPVASGIYIYQIRAGKNTATGEAILLR